MSRCSAAILIVILGLLCKQVPPIVCQQDRRNAQQLSSPTDWPWIPDNDSSRELEANYIDRSIRHSSIQSPATFVFKMLFYSDRLRLLVKLDSGRLPEKNVNWYTRTRI